MPVDFVVAKTGVPVKNGSVTINTGKRNQVKAPSETITETFLASTTWICPTNVTRVLVECIGAGGNGGAHTFAVPNMGSGGGGGGSYAASYIDVIPGTSYTISISSTDSYFKDANTVKAVKGTGGSSNNTVGGAGGAAADSKGDITISGQKGGDGTALISGAGGQAGDYKGVVGAGKGVNGAGNAGTLGAGAGGAWRDGTAGTSSGGTAGTGRVLLTYQILTVGDITAIESKYTDRFDDAGYYI